VPYDAKTGRKASTTNPATWTTFEQAVQAYPGGGQRYDGVGFVFTEGDPLCGIDLDNGRDPQTGALKPWAQQIVSDLDSYTEVSPSGTGVKIFVRASKPGPRCKTAYHDGEVEVYDRDRFFTVTGRAVEGVSRNVEARQEQVEALHLKLFGEAGPPPGPAPQPASAPALEDEQIIRLAGDWNRRDGAGRKFTDLLEGRWNSHFNSPSEADSSLCWTLAYYTKDAAQIDRIFRRSRLMRPKWDEHHGAQTYGQMTIAKALAGVTRRYAGGKRAKPRPTVAGPGGWDEIRPLDAEEPAPQIDLAACFAPVPELGRYIGAIAESYQVDPAMPAMVAMSCLSLAISRAAEVRLGPDWQQPAPIWTCPIAEPGERKSAVFAELTAPVFEYQKLHDKALQDALARHGAEVRSLVKRVETLRARQARTGDGETMQELLDLEEQLARREELKKPRLLLMDATPESVIVALHRNGEKLGLISAESSALENALGRYSENPNLDIYLQAHEGDTYVYTRRKGDDITLEHPALVMCLCIQPHAARGLLDHEAAIGRGMFARFLYARPGSLKGRRRLAAAPVPTPLRQWWSSRLIELLSLPYPGEVCDLGCGAGRQECRPRIVTLAPSAGGMFMAFRAEIERELSPQDGELANTHGWAEKFAGAVGRIALALQMAADPQALVITDAAMRGAIAWVEFLIPAFQHVVATVGLDPLQRQARLIVGWIRREMPASFSRREVIRRHRSRAFRTKEDWEPVFSLLVQHNYLKPTMVSAPGRKGGRPSEGFLVNPAMQKGE
jgi:hypothetical protein